MVDTTRLDRFARETRPGVVPPDYDALVTTARRRRRNLTAASGIAAAAVIAIVALGLQVVNDTQGTPNRPAHTPTPTTTSSLPVTRASAILGNPTASPESVAVLPDKPDSLAAAWSAPQGLAIAVTDDGFDTRTTFLLHNDPQGRGTRITAAGPDVFFVSQFQHSELVSPTGDRRPVHILHTPGPLQGGEVLVQSYLDRGPVPGYSLALDLQTATAHPIARPPDTFELYGDPSLLWSPSRTGVSWSTDGGRTWSTHQFASAPSASYEPIYSQPGTMDLYSLDEHGGLLNLIRSDDAGATWHTIAEPPTRHTYANSLNQSSKGFTWGDAVPSWTVALPDGSLLGRVRWNGSPGVPPYLITSAGPDWSRAFAVHAHLPARRGPVNVYTFEHLATVSTSGGSSVVFVYEDSIMGSLSPGLLRSTDGGQTWTQVADR